MAAEVTIDVRLTPRALLAALCSDVRLGLSTRPKMLPPKWFYDERGSELFEQITQLSEYYPAETERQILLAECSTIIDAADADTIVELGSGTSEKTLALIDAGLHHGRLTRFIPFDVSESSVRVAAKRLGSKYPGLAVHGVVGDFDRHLRHIPRGGRRLVVFLGGTIGNYAPPQRSQFLERIVGAMDIGDHLLLGTDLVKSVERMELAYNDPAGVTAAFNKNVLEVINRQLGGEFLLDQFDHVARWNPHDEWIESGLRSRVDQSVPIADLSLDVAFCEGELLSTEVSAKFHTEGVEAELAAAGLEVESWYTDPQGDFGVSLSRLR